MTKIKQTVSLLDRDITIEGVRRENSSIIRFRTCRTFLDWIRKRCLEDFAPSCANGLRLPDNKKFLIIIVEKGAPSETATFEL